MMALGRIFLELAPFFTHPPGDANRYRRSVMYGSVFVAQTRARIVSLVIGSMPLFLDSTPFLGWRVAPFFV
jgi:hypothetical protein